MRCICHEKEIITEDSFIKEFINKHLIELSFNGNNWRTLYKCKYCNMFWEEQYIDERVIIVRLVKVDEKYVIENWGSQYINK